MNSLFKNWTFFRFLRLIMGVFIIAQSIILKDWLFGLAGVLFTLMPLLNQGCCGIGNSCSKDIKTKKSTLTNKETAYEEVA